MQRVILFVLLSALLVLCYLVLQPFITPILWGAILAYITWPVYLRLRSWLGGHKTGSAVVMTLLLTAVLILPLLWIILLLRHELLDAYPAIARQLSEKTFSLPDAVRNIPGVGERLQELINQFLHDPEALTAQLEAWTKHWGRELGTVVGNVGRTAINFTLTLLTVFFFYRDGESFLRQSHRVLHRFVGNRIDPYLNATGRTVKAVVYGFVLTALTQGTLAGLGYWMAGFEAPVLLALLTALAAFIPFVGTPLLWVPASIWLLLTDHTVAGVGLLGWGVLAVSSVDNLLRPWIIGGAARIPFLLILFGVLGGIATFGFIGLFLGPVILGILMAIWREWQEEQFSALRNG